MRTAVDATMIAEARACSLRFECDDCAHFDAAPPPGRCAHGYPTAAHRPGPLAIGKVVVFCKEFELGGPCGNEERDAPDPLPSTAKAGRV